MCQKKLVNKTSFFIISSGSPQARSVFLCFFRSSALADAKLHWLHWCDFSAVWILKILLKLPGRLIWCIIYQSGLSHASSKCLSGWMHSHIGCIWKVFLLSGFSDVSSNHLHVEMHQCNQFVQESFKNILGGTSGTHMVGSILILHAIEKQATNLYTSVALTLRQGDWNLYRRIIGRRRLLNDHVSRFPDWLPTA